MRIIDDRYIRHRRHLDLAWRLIQYEVRTRTISTWTQLAGYWIRALDDISPRANSTLIDFSPAA